MAKGETILAFKKRDYPKVVNSKNIHLFLQTTMVEMNGENFFTSNIKCYSRINKNFFYQNSMMDLFGK